jgi:hypothetical protein
MKLQRPKILSSQKYVLYLELDFGEFASIYHHTDLYLIDDILLHETFSTTLIGMVITGVIFVDIIGTSSISAAGFLHRYEFTTGLNSLMMFEASLVRRK